MVFGNLQLDSPNSDNLQMSIEGSPSNYRQKQSQRSDDCSNDFQKKDTL